MINIDLKWMQKFASENVMETCIQRANEGLDKVVNGTGLGNDFLGWVTLPSSIDHHLLDEYESIVKRWKGKVDVVVVVGIGGSYLGAKCAIEALSHTFHQQMHTTNPQIIFAGQNISEDYLAEMFQYLHNKTYAKIGRAHV